MPNAFAPQWWQYLATGGPGAGGSGAAPDSDPTGQGLLSWLRQYDPNATWGVTGGGVEGSPSYGYTYDRGRFPTSQAGAFGSFQPADGRDDLINPNAVYDDPIYGKVTPDTNIQNAPPGVLGTLGPLAVAVLTGGMASGFIPGLLGLEAAGAGAAAGGAGALGLEQAGLEAWLGADALTADAIAAYGGGAGAGGAGGWGNLAGADWGGAQAGAGPSWVNPGSGGGGFGWGDLGGADWGGAQAGSGPAWVNTPTSPVVPGWGDLGGADWGGAQAGSNGVWVNPGSGGSGLLSNVGNALGNLANTPGAGSLLNGLLGNSGGGGGGLSIGGGGTGRGFGNAIAPIPGTIDDGVRMAQLMRQKQRLGGLLGGGGGYDANA